MDTGKGIIPLSASNETATMHGKANKSAFHGLTSRKNLKSNNGLSHTAISTGRSPPERNKKIIARISQPYTNTNDFALFMIFPLCLIVLMGFVA
jgi:hypothetical protein